MNAPQANIRKTFDTELQLFCAQAGLDWRQDVAWPNIEFKANPNKLYLRPYLLYGAAESASLGLDGFHRFTGIYQISVFEVANTGLGQVEELIVKLIERFKAGTVLNACGDRILITSAYQGTPDPEDRLHIPVSIVWNCYSQRQIGN